MEKELAQLHQAHQIRQHQRIGVRQPIIVVAVLLIAGFLVVGGIVGYSAHRAEKLVEGAFGGVSLAIVGVILAVLWSRSAQLLTEWDRALVLRLGKFHSVRGPGFFMIIPVIDQVKRILDMRVRTTAFRSEAILTKDTVPVGLDAIAFWHVWDGQKAVLEVESYYQAIVLAILDGCAKRCDGFDQHRVLGWICGARALGGLETTCPGVKTPDCR